MNIDINNPRLKILLIILAVILVVVFVFALYAVNKKMKLESQKGTSAPVTETQEKNKPLTPEEIQEALNKKAEVPEGQTPALTPQEIQNALNKKAPTATDAKPLTPEEIQSALNAKAN